MVAWTLIIIEKYVEVQMLVTNIYLRVNLGIACKTSHNVVENAASQSSKVKSKQQIILPSIQCVVALNCRLLMYMICKYLSINNCVYCSSFS